MSGRKFHIWVEVVAETRASAERKALYLAKEEWDDAILPPDRVF